MGSSTCACNKISVKLGLGEGLFFYWILVHICSAYSLGEMSTFWNTLHLDYINTENKKARFFGNLHPFSLRTMGPDPLGMSTVDLRGVVCLLGAPFLLS